MKSSEPNEAATRAAEGCPPETVDVRSARPPDAPLVLKLIRELAEFEGAELPEALTQKALEEMLAPPEPRLTVLLAQAGVETLGYVSYMTRFSAWAAAEFICVDDLYVQAGARGRGVGTALMNAVAVFARSRGSEVRWEARIDNLPAHAFYESLGATVGRKVICRWRP